MEALLLLADQRLLRRLFAGDPVAWVVLIGGATAVTLGLHFLQKWDERRRDQRQP